MKCKIEMPNINKNDALAAVVASVAAEENALASLIQAESEKIRFAIEKTDPENSVSMELLARINESVDSVIARTVELQGILKEKLRLTLGHIPKPPAPPPRPCPPSPICKEFNNLPFPIDMFYPPQKAEFAEKYNC